MSVASSNAADEEEFFQDVAELSFLGFRIRTGINRRTATELATTDVECKKEDREDLNTKDLRKLKSDARQGLTTKFDLLPTEVAGGIDIGSVYSTGIRTSELKASVELYDMSDVFEIYTFDAHGMPDELVSPRNLFDAFVDISLEQVKANVRFFNECGESYHVQNNAWSAAKIANSVSDTLKDLLLDKTSAMPPCDRGGPTSFKLIMDLITTTSEPALRKLIGQLGKLTLQDFDGENVTTACGWIRGVINILKAGRMLPHDHMTIVCKVLKTASHAEFVTQITTFQTLMSMNISMIAKDLDALLTKAENDYITYKQEGHWAGETHKGSVFLAANSNSSDTRKCYNCNKIGHISPQCPSPKKRIAGSSTSEDLTLVPSRGSDKVKKFADGKERSWCGRCGLWGDHLLSGCTKDPVPKSPPVPTPVPTSTPSANVAEVQDEEETPVVGLTFTGVGI